MDPQHQRIERDGRADVRRRKHMLKQPCVICLENVEHGELLLTDCGHPFHVECWRGYMLNELSRPGLSDLDLHLIGFAGPSCPSCRSEFPRLARLATFTSDLVSLNKFNEHKTYKMSADTVLLMALKGKKY